MLSRWTRCFLITPLLSRLLADCRGAASARGDLGWRGFRSAAAAASRGLPTTTAVDAYTDEKT